MYAELAFDLPIPHTFTYRVPEGLAVAVGVRAVAPFAGRKLTGFVVSLSATSDIDPKALKELTRVVDAEPLVEEADFARAKWVADTYLSAFGEALHAMTPSGRRESAAGSAFGDVGEVSEDAPTPSDEQRSAIDAICSSPSGRYYLEGITGSGKTEVFLQAAEATIAGGRAVIYLVPEIALSHQVTKTIRGRFGDIVAVIHSRLTPSQRLSEWRRIRRGEARFVVGARSAVFAPVQRLGLIVIDEEHEGSYKSGTAPRYHARGVAMWRADTEGARLVMGSATPSVEAVYGMKEGIFRRMRLTKRLAGGSMPTVELVNLRGEERILSRVLERRMRETLDSGRQVILFLNRRGFSYFFHCKTCGYEMSCDRCSVGLTYHRNRNRMVCHYCGYSSAPVQVCPDCGSLDVGYSGIGTEGVEEEVRERFAPYVVARIDTDTAQKKGQLEAALDAFRSGKTQILLGTQMVAKGLNFPGVQLVGIVSADTGLHLPDFRAAERTFSLITQVAGRAGRFYADGRVVVQTFAPDNPAIAMAVAGSAEEFFTRELAVRRELEFPPFARLLRVVVRGRDQAEVQSTVDRLARRIVDNAVPGVSVLGPAECPIARIAYNHRYQITLRAVTSKAARVSLKRALDGMRTAKTVYIESDVDPVSLL